MLKLNLGCGEDIQEGYVNIDIRKTTNEVVEADVRHLPYEEDSVDVIRAKDVFEHVSFRQSKELLKHWVSKLKKGGKLIVVTPSLPDIMDIARTEHQIRSMYSPDIKAIERIIRVIFGGQEYPENTHFTIGHPVLMKSYLRDAGITGDIDIVTGVENTTNMKVKAIK